VSFRDLQIGRDCNLKIEPTPEYLQLIKEVYLDASENMRHYGNMRFLHLTLFVAITGTLLNEFSFGKPSIRELLFALLGLLNCWVFAVMERRINQYFNHYWSVAGSLERDLRLIGGQHSTRKNVKIALLLTSARAVALLFVVIAIMWFASLLLSLKNFG
jgi:hypothetical protein